MQPRERVPYSAIVDRPALDAAGRRPPRRVDDRQRRGLGHRAADAADRAAAADGPAAAARPAELGLARVRHAGRLLAAARVLQPFGITPTLAINGNVCSSYPRVAEAALDAGWEFMGHGFVQGPMHRLDDQRARDPRHDRAIRALHRQAPRGWESPGLTETYETPDLLREAGIEYVADWVLDDQPVRSRPAPGRWSRSPTRSRPTTLPCTPVQHLPSDALCRRGVDQFERLYQESATITRVMAISLHPYITGVPIGSATWRSSTPTCCPARAC